MLVFSLRGYTVGSDTPNYHSYFVYANSIKDYGFKFVYDSNYFEFGYSLLNYIVAYIAPNFTFMLIAESLIAFIPLYILVKRYSIKPELSYFLFIVLCIYLQYFNGARQSLATSIIFLSIKYIFERKIIKFVIVVYIASLFHVTAFAFLPIYFLPLIKLNLKTLLFFIIFFILFLLFYFPVLKLISAIPGMRDYYTAYGPNSDKYNTDNACIGYIGFIFLIVFVVIYYNRNTIYQCLPQHKDLFDFFMLLFLIGSSIYLVGMWLGVVRRINYYFYFSSIIIVPYLIILFPNNTSQILRKDCNQYEIINSFNYSLIIAIGFAYFIYQIHFLHMHGSVPYTLFFQ